MSEANQLDQHRSRGNDGCPIALPGLTSVGRISFMSKTVFILGAGASADVGAPLMANFLDTAERLLATSQVDDEAHAFGNVFNAIHKLQAVYAKSFIDSRNLESVFTA